MRIAHKSIDDLVPYASNARTHSEEQVAKIAASIKEFGFNNPVLIDSDRGIIAGHGRVAAARKLGMEKVPTICLDHLSDGQRRAYILADNRLALDAGWDEEVLAAELERLAADDIDLGLTGFGEEELADLLAEKTEGQTDPDEVPEVEEQAVTLRGDVWLLGRHRLMCGDSSDPRDVAALLQDEKVGSVVLDPPYEMKEAVWAKWIMDPCIVFGQAVHIRMVPADLWRFERVVVKRHKHRSATVQLQHQHAFIAQCGTDKRLPEDKQVTLPSVVEQEQDTQHDHQKPAALVVEHLQHWTPPEAVPVVDPFGGSGTTVIACEQVGRPCRTMELDERYCDVIVRRWQDFTGEKARHEDSTVTFAEVEEQRRG